MAGAVVRFLVGRAGSGKTHAVVSAVRRELLEDPVDGPRLLLLVPEQASLQTEAALLAPGGPGASERAEVLSFRRLARRVLTCRWVADASFAAVPPGTVLSAAARAMVLRQLVRANRERLLYWKRVDRFPGFLDRLARTIEELIEEAVEPEALLRGADPGAPGALGARGRKLADLSLLYRAYLDALAPDRVDPSQFLEIARRHFGACPFLSGARVFVDGFAGFTRGERLALADLAALAAEMTIAVLGDPDGREDADARTVGALFRKTARTRLEIRRALAERGVAAPETIAVRPGADSRFSRSPALAALERRLFVFPPRPEPPAALAGVEIRELPTRRLEADYAACRIHDLVRESGGRLRYRDVAIVARDLEPYHDLLGAALAARGIPYFIDRRRSIAHHPLVECVRSLARLAAEKLSIDSVRLALKTDLFDLDRNEADEIENALLAHGIEGPAAWTETDGDAWRFAASSAAEWDAVAAIGRAGGAAPVAPKGRATRLENARDRFLAGVRPVLAAAGVLSSSASTSAVPRPLTGAAWADAIRKTLESLRVETKLEAFAAEAEAALRVDEADAHRRVAADVEEFLSSLEKALGDAPLDAETLSSVVDAGLSTLTLGLAPATADQVLVGAVERSRHPDLRVVFLIGLDDKTFPRSGTEDAILSDDDREALLAAGLSVASPNRERVPEEALLAYIAVTRPSERLVVTYSVADEKGRALRPSPFVAAIAAALPPLSAVRVGDPFRGRETFCVRSPSDLAAALAFEMRARPERAREPAPAARATWNAIYERARVSDPLRERLRGALASLVFENRVEPLGEKARALLYDDKAFVASVTRLESFAACPFRHFAKYALSLREREEWTLQPTDRGRVQHKILEVAIGEVASKHRALGDVSDAEIGSLVDATAERVAAAMPRASAAGEPERRHLIERSRADLRRVLGAQARVARAGEFRPFRTELGFGREKEGDLPPLVLETPGQRRVELRGVIDRVDMAESGGRRIALVIDYKGARGKKLVLDEVRYGLSLQLTTYLLALSEGAGALPGGAFYVSLASAYDKVDHPSLFDPEAAIGKGPHRPRGLVADDVIERLETDFPAGTWARHYSLFKKSDGTLGNVDKTDGAPRAAFDAVLEETRGRIASLADGILAGDVSVAPYRLRDASPCRFCEFVSACRFEFGQRGLRPLDALKRSAVLGIAPPASPAKENA